MVGYLFLWIFKHSQTFCSFLHFFEWRDGCVLLNVPMVRTSLVYMLVEGGGLGDVKDGMLLFLVLVLIYYTCRLGFLCRWQTRPPKPSIPLFLSRTEG